MMLLVLWWIGAGLQAMAGVVVFGCVVDAMWSATQPPAEIHPGAGLTRESDDDYYRSLELVEVD